MCDRQFHFVLVEKGTFSNIWNKSTPLIKPKKWSLGRCKEIANIKSAQVFIRLRDVIKILNTQALSKSWCTQIRTPDKFLFLLREKKYLTHWKVTFAFSLPHCLHLPPTTPVPGIICQQNYPNPMLMFHFLKSLNEKCNCNCNC